MRPIFIKDNIKYLRYLRGLSQRDLAKEIYQSHNVISQWEHDFRIPNITNIIALTDFFEVNLDDFVFTDLSKDDKFYNKNETYYFRKEREDD